MLKILKIFHFSRLWRCASLGAIVMGLDFLDFTFRVQKSFGIKIERNDNLILPRKSISEVTAGELHDWVIQLCGQRGVKVPHSSWNRIRMALGIATGKSPMMIRRETLIVRDLGFS